MPDLTTETASANTLALVARSPEIVARGDKEGWIDLFDAEAFVEDPVGAGTHRGHDALRKFWDVFIAPQEAIVFRPKRDFVAGDHVLRYVRIATTTPVSEDVPFEIPAIIEYRLRDSKIVSLRAFWQANLAVTWHLGQGVRGAWSLTKHGARTFATLGLAATLGFGNAMRPTVSERDARRVAGLLACGTAEEWRSEAGRADVLIDGRSANAEELAGGSLVLEELIRAGDSVACVLGLGDEAICAIVTMPHGRVSRVDLLRS